MNNGFVHAILLLVIVGVVYLIYSRSGNRAPTYTMNESWTHAPVLWAATDEVVPGGGHGDHHGNVVNIGGGASGRW